jgi:hypothetical protein
MHRRDSIRSLLALPFLTSGAERMRASINSTSPEWINVRTTGALANGADDSGAFQAAFDRVRNGGTVYVPPGQYSIARPLVPAFVSSYRKGIQVRLLLDPGAVLVGTIEDPGAAVLDCRGNPGQDGSFLIDGGIIEGAGAAIGVRIGTQNVALQGTVIRRFSSAGIDFSAKGTAPSIRASLHRVALLFNGIGLRCDVSSSGLSLQHCWIEANAREGMMVHGAGHVSIADSVVETNGVEVRTSPQLSIRGRGTTSVNITGSYFESLPTQAHQQISVEGAEEPVRSFHFSGNHVAGYSVEGAVGVVIGQSGVVDNVVVLGNTFAGGRTGVVIGQYARGYSVSGNAWSDSFADPPNVRVSVDVRRNQVVRTSRGAGDIHLFSSTSDEVRTVTRSEVLLATDRSLFCEASTRALTLTIPSAWEVAGRTLVIKKVDSSPNAVDLVSTGGEQIEGAPRLSLRAAGQYVTIQSDGTRWWKVGGN